MPPTSASSRSAAASRACDNCKRRKVRCDTSAPCANCTISRLLCAYTIPQRKRGPKVPHTAHSAQARRSATLFITTIAGSPVSEDQAILTPEPLAFSPTDQEAPQTLSPFRQAASSIISPTAQPNASPGVSKTSPSLTRSWLISLEGLRDSLLSAPDMAPLHLKDIGDRLVDLYMQYTFPTAPLVHEPTMIASAAFFFSEDAAANSRHVDSGQQRIMELRAFALLTALCASVAAVMPDTLLPYRHLLVRPFYKASRQTLLEYEDYDLEHPDSSSLTIRMFHSTTVQHMTGKHGAAWHLQGQATLIAQNLRLYSESAVGQFNPLESQLLRFHFWQLYASDHFAAALRHRPIVLHEWLFDEPMTLQAFSGQHVPLTDPDKPSYDEAFENQLLHGFNWLRRVESTGAKLVLHLRKHGIVGSEGDRGSYLQDYFDYAGLLDEIPPWLQAAKLKSSPDDDEVLSLHNRSFWVQRCTVLTTFHCLHLFLVQQCVEGGLLDVVGLSDQPLALWMKKLDIIRDFIQALDDIPFIYLQVKGEPNVERIRSVGSILLELAQTIDNETMKTRAWSYSQRLLDVLARLNSKASDEVGVSGLEVA
ncbi:hypothetical protein P154DRAFT_423924 [Amniculicola lignicola CBS 123094]|uniref:Zn(2)-C6 fungal-type domain-containing protein n=1 Tax=Amniculicola lignicola CBS 123094 TaxID=1392246 RepID=A0A6A5X2K4_9PLEO|nr:hypothetical protein P154DRAFT_423924 [Amniculicola lignicola CBS 123094]